MAPFDWAMKLLTRASRELQGKSKPVEEILDERNVRRKAVAEYGRKLLEDPSASYSEVSGNFAKAVLEKDHAKIGPNFMRVADDSGEQAIYLGLQGDYPSGMSSENMRLSDVHRVNSVRETGRQALKKKLKDLQEGDISRS